MKKIKEKMSVLETGCFKVRKNGKLVREPSYRHLVIPDGVTEIGDECFLKENILSIEIPESVIKIGYYGLSYFRGKELKLPSGLCEIGEGAFKHGNFKEILIPGGVKVIPYAAFHLCENLETLTISNGVEKIESYAFAFCSKLKRIVFPSTLKSIDRYAFYGCVTLEEIVLPDGLELIGTNAFATCNIKKVNIPSGAKIGTGAFFEYWRTNGLCGYCGGEVKDGKCANPSCEANKEKK